MNVTFIAHSGFLVEWEHFYTLFDWWKGELPPLDADKPLLVFASHNHHDHFDPQIFQLLAEHPDTRYILSHDIRLPSRKWDRLGMTQEIFSRVTRMRADSVYAIEVGGAPLTIRTVSSTDAGVAFLLSAEGRLVYHAGDNNWWHWEEEGKQYCTNMAALYQRSIARLAAAVQDEAADCGCAPVLDVAMAPLDTRLEDAYGLGIAYLMEQIPVKRLFPMHIWDKFDWIDRYCREHPADAERIVPIHADGASFIV